MAVSIKRKKPSLKKKRSIKNLERHVYREVIIASQKKVSLTLPKTLVGKTVEVFAFEVPKEDQANVPVPKPFSKREFWDTFGTGKNSLMTAESIREKAWRKNQW